MNMTILLDILLPKKPSRLYFIVRNGVLIVICAFFAASAIQSYLEYRLEPLEASSVQSADDGQPADTSTPHVSRKEVQIQAIVDRNIFGGSTEPAPQDEEDISLDEIPLAENLKDLRLLGTIVHSDQPGWAIIENKKKRKQELLREGDSIEEAKIKKILRNNVVIQLGDEDKVLSIDYKTRQRMKERTSSSAPETSAEVDDSMITLDRNYVISSLSNVNDVMRSARILPYLENGDPIGFRLNAIRSNSFFDKLQLKNGDIILGADGEPVTSPQRLLQMAEQLKNQNQVSLKVRRGDKDLELEYNLQ
jgi:type II secretion system protein C